MRLAVHGVGGLGGGRVDEAEDRACALVDPVAQVADAVLRLRLEIGEVCLANVLDGDPAVDAVHVHEERHACLLLSRVWLVSGRSTLRPMKAQASISSS